MRFGGVRVWNNLDRSYILRFGPLLGLSMERVIGGCSLDRSEECGEGCDNMLAVR